MLEERQVLAGGGPTSLLLSASPVTSSTYGQTVQLTATVTNNAGLADPFGDVEFYDGGVGGNLLQTVSLINGTSNDGKATATYSLSTLSVGSHTLAAKFLGNSTFNPTSGTLSYSVDKATLLVTANDDSREYGDPNPAFSAKITGFVNGEELGTSGVTGAPGFTTSATASSPVSGSPYAIHPSLGTLTSTHYNFTFADGKLAITPAKLTVKPDDASRPYGQANPALTAKISGFKNNEELGTSDVTGTLVLSTSADSTSHVNDYPITASGLSSTNYTFSYVPGVLHVTKATLLVTADDAEMVRGDALPSPTTKITGFLNGDLAAVVSGAATAIHTATTSSPAGYYPITVDVSSLTASDYKFQGVSGTLKVRPKVNDVVVHWGSKSMSIVGLGRDLPFANISSIEVIFSDPVDAVASSANLKGQLTGNNAFSGFGSASTSKTWSRADLALDRYTFSLSGVSLGAHSDIALGGPTSWAFAVLPGDWDGDGTVTSADTVGLRAAASVPYSVWADINGNGVIDTNDMTIARGKVGTKLPPLPV